ncbi:hypothetical protein TBC1_12875 [Lentimicrobium saccharophilum]|uniref:Uncharacterized protein n=1 Tax=Lentimicrobium saccharophilum TaxID=1678841 RepID=A0A0S7C338_9BACT|nr:hypothetical protein [Lentimicrobium saccharophilum]GAP45058.1 hypothetical protein TBC1_12875 [Lentimicrobium saccharophilum]
MRKTFFFALLTMIFPAALHAQAFNSLLGDESVFIAQTKQVNQFFRRFNGEEGTTGDRFYSGDKDFRSFDLRQKYLHVLFDYQNSSITDPLKDAFISDVLDPESPAFLNFHDGQWFAEVTTRFLYQGKDEELTLFLKLEQENLGHKWVISNVYFRHFQLMFSMNTETGSHFLHPLSHELDFMNLVRVFKEKDYVELYTEKDYLPDYLTLFLYEFKKGSLKFKTVSSVKFHFFQVPGWYFELSDFNRPGGNSGWLISGLMKINEEQKNILLKYIYHE